MKEPRPYDLSLFDRVKHEPTPYNLNINPMKTPKLYKDKLHGFTAHSLSKTGAWMLIRSKCHELGLQVPTQDQIVKCSKS